MPWDRVEAVCDCPGQIESWHAFVSSEDGVSRDEAAAIVWEAAMGHLEESTYCSEDDIEIEAYHRESLPL